LTRRVRLVVAYDGTPFHGFAANAGVRTVMGDLSAAIETVVRKPVKLTGAGRTDAGVHAWGQVVSGDLPAGTDLDDLARRLNKLCAPAIAVRSAEWATDEFDARFSARWREYRYDVWNAATPNPLLAGRAWFVPQPLTRWAMEAACDPLIGEHDFTSFCRHPGAGKSTVRDLQRLTVRRHGDRLDLGFRANAFLHQMVRALTGTLVAVGEGRIDPDAVADMLAARDRATARQMAPAHGLTLERVVYGRTRR
jgi:tRNA pseudouridine38-40 synthase